MNDHDLRRLLAGIDAPRPLPEGVRAEVLRTLTSDDLAVGAIDGPRPLPVTLRQDIESALLAAPSEVGGWQQRHQWLLGAAALVVALAGFLALVSGPFRDTSSTVAGPAVGEDQTGRATAGQDGVVAGGSDTSGVGGSGSTATAPDAGMPLPPPSDVPFADDDPETSGDAAGPAGGGSASPAVGRSGPGQITVATTGKGTAVAAGFDAYLRVLNAGGGIDGRPLVAVPAGTAGAVATVNLGESPVIGAVEGVVLETVYVDDARLRGTVVSLASPLERQAHLAVAEAFPEPAPGARAAIYTSASEPWATVVPAALEDALRERSVTPVRVPAAPRTFVPTDSAFLSLSPDDLRAWLTDAPGPPAGGVWAVASGWDEQLAAVAERLSLTVLSPYAPADTAEQRALLDALPAGTSMSAASVHGWVTAKALAVLLDANGGQPLGDDDLDRLHGWRPGWAPPFEVRPGTRARVPEAIVLRPRDGRFVPAGVFLRA